MRLIFTLFSLLLLSFSSSAQKLTGIWRGYFSSSSGIYREGANPKEEMYKYEIQIDQQSNNGVKGVTYSYKSTIFYGKAELQGIYTVQSKTLILKETKLVDLKVAGVSEPCLMTCYLDYSKVGNMEFLQGTFISVNVKDKGDCGSGKIYLEKVTTSDFKKEDFLLKKKEIDSAKRKADEVKALSAKPETKKPDVVPPAKNNTASVPKNTDKPKATPSRPATDNANKSKDDKSKQPQVPFVDRIPQVPVNTERTDTVVTPKSEAIIRKIPIPKVLIERENILVKTIVVDQENIQISFYDGGIIDNDTISVYHNNELVSSKSRLSEDPITIKIKSTKTDSHHEIIVVAENLGEIPPNTCIMVITAAGGKFRREIFITSTEVTNAKVIIDYKPKE